MTLEQMRIFREAARFGSFTAAANNLGLTQSAVSMSIKRIEERNNVVLFERLGKGLILTDAGQFLLREVSRILGNIDLLTRRLSGYETHGGTPAALACTHHAYNFWMPGIVSYMGNSKPPLNDLISGGIDDVTAWVMRGTVDVGLTEREPSHPQFRHFSAFEDRILLVGTPERAKEIPDRVGLDTLEKYGPVVWAFDDHDQMISEAIAGAGADPSRLQRSAFRFRSVDAVLSALMHGRLIGFAPETAARSAIAAGHLVPIGDVEIKLTYYLFCKTGYDMGDFASRIAAAALEMSRSRLD